MGARGGVYAGRRIVPLERDVHMDVAIHVLAQTERLASRPVRLVYDWLSTVFGPANPWFAPELNLQSLRRDSLSKTMAQLIAGPETDVRPPRK